MNTVIYISKFHETALKGIIERLKDVNPAALNENHVVIVPDRYTLSVEKSVYSSLEKKGSFNISVLTFKRLASMFISGAKYLSSSGAVMLVGKAVKDVSRLLEAFKGSVRFPGFADGMYREICRFKNSMITPEMLAEASDRVEGELKCRLSDIAAIYKRYEELAEGKYIDTSGCLKLIADNAADSEYIKNSYFYFAGFDSLTNAEKNCFKEIIKNCRGCCFAVSAAGGCENDVKAVLTQAECNIKTVEIPDYAELSEEIYNNLECGKVAYSGNLGYIKLYSFSDIIDETENAAQDIVCAVRKGGLRFRDISVIVNNESGYLYPLEKVFRRYKIPYFVSDSESLNSMPLFKAVVSLMDCAAGNCALTDVTAFIKNRYFGLSGEEADCFENYCVKWGIDRGRFTQPFTLTDGKDEIEKAEKTRQKFVSFLDRVTKHPQPADKFVWETERLIDIFRTLEDAGVTGKMLAESGYPDEASYNSQVAQKFLKQLGELAEILGNETLSLKEFRDMLVSGAQSLKLSIIPVSADVVTCGGIDSARYSGAKYVYILGAGEGLFPSAEFPEYMISASETEKLPLLKGAEGNPGDLILRERENIKRFLSQKRQRLTVSYSDGAKEIKPSEYFTRLVKLTGTTPQNFLKYRLRTEKAVCRKNEESLECAKELYFPTGMTSVSALETYFSCPKKFFYRYGLFFTERAESRIESFDTGNLFHEAVKLFAQRYKTGQDAENLALKCFSEALESGKYEKFFSTAPKIAALERLRCEFTRTCGAVSYQIDNSKFKPSYFEAEFDRDGDFPPVNLNTKFKNVSLKGSIDRADVFESGGKKYIRVIDYKTGKIKYDDGELYFGKKIQLFIYMHALTENGFSPAGLYYFPMRDSFAEQENLYKLLGLTVNEKLLLSASDKSFDFENGESMILDICKGRKNESKNLTDPGGIQERINYSVKLAECAVNEILSGNISQSPDKESCGRCQYKNVCLENLDSVKIRKFPANKNFFQKEASDDGTEH